VYAFAHFLQAPDTAPEGMPHTKVRSDYLLMLTQCILGLAVMLLPSMSNRTLLLNSVCGMLEYGTQSSECG